MSEACRILDWDSAFFGFRIARLDAARARPEQMSADLAWCARERVRCLYLLVSADNGPLIQAAESNGFHLSDIRMTFARQSVKIGMPATVRPFVSGDLPEVERIASFSHADSRFYSDLHFPRERCHTLYATWIRKSCEGGAQAVLVADRGGKAAGYITCNWNEERGSIGLVAVAENLRGHGLGRDLVEAAISTFADNNVRAIQVVTQGRNLASQRLYQRCGFTTKAVELWYHRWFE